MKNYSIYSTITGAILVPSISLPSEVVESLSSASAEGHFRAGDIPALVCEAGLAPDTLVYAI
jgi:hypothetical protein